MIDLKKWLDVNRIEYISILENVYEIATLGRCLYISEKDGKIFDDSLNILLTEEEELRTIEDGIEHFIFQFGNNIFYSKTDISNNFDMKILKYMGIDKLHENELQYPFLGIHGKYELMNGSFDYSEWCKKANFLNIKSLGICEKNTLAGTLPFQLACDKEKIQAILGETITIKSGTRFQYDVKLYVINEKGWKNLVSINTYINVFEENRFINLNDLLQFGEGLVLIINPATFDLDKSVVNALYKAFDETYYQLDSLVYINDEIDKKYLTNLTLFINSKLSPILINDAYYLDADQQELKTTLNSMINYNPLSSGTQHFKSFSENLEILKPLFRSEDEAMVKLLLAIENCNYIAEICKYNINTKERHLPEYNRQNKEIEKYKSNDDMFLDLLEQGFREKILRNSNKEINRVEYEKKLDFEISIIQKGGFADYFLILWDIVQFCKRESILYGFGRGSAAGCLITYLLDITKVDPLEYNLLFERFLDLSRIKTELPDIDFDVDSNRKDEIKKYIENRYGEDRVCSMGTYSTLQLKAAIQDLSRQKRIPIDTVRFLSTILDFDKTDPNWIDLIKQAVQKPFVKDFVVANPDIVENIQLCLGQPKASSVHACAMLILPEGTSMYDTIPIRIGEVNGQQILISEWEGEFLEKAGYLKEDILGILQLTKFQMIKDLVKSTVGEEIDIYNIPLDEPEVYSLFRKGMNGDVFHLGSKGLTQYALEVQPKCIDDLIAMLALYRPGPMENNFHKDYINRKIGLEEVTYDYMCEEITKETYGLIIYQEEVMQICVRLGGFSLSEANLVRKAMGKKIKSLIDEYKDRFIKGAINNDCPKDEAIHIWEKLEKFATYAFNKSHATCYAITGYTCQYLKWKYPIQYWTTALEFAKEDDIIKYIAEINKTKQVDIISCDINVSGTSFISSFEKKEIYWSIGKVKQCGEIATKEILEERKKNDEFYSFEEFLTRMRDRKVNKLVVENLIFAGAFDRLENLKLPIDRLKLLNFHREFNSITKDKSERDKDIKTCIENGMVQCDWWWLLFQKAVSGYAFFNYDELIRENDVWDKYEYMSIASLNLGEFEEGYFSEISDNVFAGIIQEIDVRVNSKGEEFCRLLLENNYDQAWIYIRGRDNWGKYKNYITGCGKGGLFIGNGNATYNKWLKQNVIQSTSDFDCEILTLFEN